MEQIIPEYWKNLSLENIIYLDNEGKECEEQWKDVVGYEGLYIVSDCGRIKTLARKSKTKWESGGKWVKEKIKPSFPTKLGYRRVEISKDGVNKKYFVHRLVAISFIPNNFNKPDINHKKGVKYDNRVSEIEWITPSENRIHALIELNAATGRPWLNCKKEDHPMFGRTGSNAPSSKKIKCIQSGERFDSIKSASITLKIPPTVIKYLLTGKTKKSKYGLTFEFL